MHIEYQPKLAISEIVRKLKGQTSRKLQQKYPELQKRYWGKYFWVIAYGVWSIGNIADVLRIFGASSESLQ